MGQKLSRGSGAPAVKSAALSSVSVLPRPLRRSAVMLDSVGADADPSKQFAAPYPTKSMTDADDSGHAPLNAVVLLTSATLPAVALMLIEPAASGAGSGVFPPVPAASWTRK